MNIHSLVNKYLCNYRPQAHNGQTLMYGGKINFVPTFSTRKIMTVRQKKKNTRPLTIAMDILNAHQLLF